MRKLLGYLVFLLGLPLVVVVAVGWALIYYPYKAYTSQDVRGERILQETLYFWLYFCLMFIGGQK